MGRLRHAVEVDVSAAVPLPGRHVVRGSLIAPMAPVEPFVWCCLPGGQCTTGYFDLAVDGDDSSYSMAAHLADAGCTVLTVDHLGTGASSRTGDEFLLTPEIIAAADHAAITELLGRLRIGSLAPQLAPIGPLVPIGLGHSMGGLLTVLQQACHGTYDAVVNLGAAGAGLPEYLRDPAWATADPGAVRATLTELARAQFGAPSAAAARGSGRALRFHADDVPAAVRAAYRRQTTNVLPACALAAILPSFADPETAALTVPVFLGFGEYDLCTDPHDCVRRYRSCPDITLTVLAGSGHCHNQAGNRRQLWDRLLAWARSVPPAAR